LKQLANKTLSIPIGRAVLTFRTANPLPTERFPIPDLCISAKLSPLYSLVEFDATQMPSNFKDWPEFHNGVAAGLRLSEGSAYVDSSWITFNQKLSDDNHVIFDSKYAGFIFGLGLNGYLQKMNTFDYYSFLVAKNNVTSLGVSLGLAASYVGTSNPQITKLLNIHVQGLLPPGSAQLNVPITTQIVCLFGLGLVYMGSVNRKMTVF
jgi:anaphase-promoting complex subunit 1